MSHVQLRPPKASYDGREGCVGGVASWPGGQALLRPVIRTPCHHGTGPGRGFFFSGGAGAGIFPFFCIMESRLGGGLTRGASVAGSRHPPTITRS